MSNLEDEKLKKVLINNFFKTKYFRELDLDKYQVKNYDYHQLCFILKFSPEAMLYSVDKFSTMKNFDNTRLHKFLKVRYSESLYRPFNEEQLYFYYAIKMFNFNDILVEMKDEVLKSNNQILIAYYLKDAVFKSDDIEVLKKKNNESYWFQNYHLILFTEDLLVNLESSIEKYLIPVEAKKEKQKKSYMDFYKKNLSLKNSIIRKIKDVNIEVKEYLNLRIEESEKDFISEEIEE